jgi:hypothetical protein
MKGVGLVNGPDDSADAIVSQVHDGGSVAWTGGAGVLVVIVGDIVDGQRVDQFGNMLSQVSDARGNIELLLHAYLFNLRIKARLAGSEIRFVAGNHDIATVIDTQVLDLYSHYVHHAATAFFGDYSNRRRSLLPFYDCCPYIFLSIGNEIAFVHGGLHDSDGTYNHDIIKGIQQKIDNTGHLGAMSLREGASRDSDMNKMKSLGEVATRTGPDGPFWSRYYKDQPAAVACAAISRGVYNMTVVGHCPTGEGSDHFDEILASGGYDPVCRGSGCVLLGCKGSKGGRKGQGRPALAFVDITMSEAFAPGATWTSEQERRAEFLKITLMGEEINKIERLPIRPVLLPPIVVWAASTRGGRRTLRARRGYRKTR